jgi:acetyltransferase-like isoleucine patch superfamily enzyme
MIFRAIEQRYVETWRTAVDRLRAGWLRWRGARLGRGVRIGTHAVVHRPWCLDVGERAQFEHQVYLKAVTDQASIRIGNRTFVGFGCEFDVADRLLIGDGVLIAPGCFITDHNHLHGAHATIASQGIESAPVVIEDDAWLGANVVVLPGVTIGRGAIVAAGAVVTGDIESMVIAGGVPARPIGRRR